MDTNKRLVELCAKAKDFQFPQGRRDDLALLFRAIRKLNEDHALGVFMAAIALAFQWGIEHDAPLDADIWEF